MNWYELFRFASYDDWHRQNIEQLSRNNPRPFKAWFGEGDRVYLPFNSQGGDSPQVNEHDEYVFMVLKEYGYTVTDYQKGLCSKEVVTYPNGRNAPGVPKAVQYSIGRILSQLMNTEIKEHTAKLQQAQVHLAQLQQAAQNVQQPAAQPQQGVQPVGMPPEQVEANLAVREAQKELNQKQKFWKDTLNDFNTSPSRANASSQETGFRIVISQNAHDIAQMSTGRDWTSCMALPTEDDEEGGSNHRHIFCEVQEGGLVAYLIRANDPEIKAPLARIHIRRFVDKQGNSIAVPEKAVYGNEVEGFSAAVAQWLKSKQGDVSPGMYTRKGGEWSDTFGDDMLVAPTKPEDVQAWLRGEGQDAVRKEYLVRNWVKDWKRERRWDDEDDEEQEEHRFDTREEADNFVNNHYYTKYDDWRHDYGDEWLDEDEDEEGNPSGVWSQPAFDVTEKTHDLRDQQKRHAVERILENPSQYGADVLQQVHDFLFARNVISTGNDRLKKQFYKLFPNLVTQEDLASMGVKGELEFMQSLPANDPRRAAMEQGLYKDVLYRAANPYESIPSWQASQNPLPYESDTHSRVRSEQMMSSRMLTEFNEYVLEPLRAIDKPVPEEITQQLTKTALDYLAQYEERKKTNPHTLNEEMTLSRYMIWLFRDTKTDTPSVQNFYSTMLKYWGDDFIDHRRVIPVQYSPINVDSLGEAIGVLGENGRQFIPFIQEKYQQEKQRLGVAMAAGNDDIVNRLTGNIRSFKSILDRLQGGRQGNTVAAVNWYQLSKVGMKLVKAMEISGEYWIDDGQAQYADGDVGDYNHEAIIIERVMGEFGLEGGFWDDKNRRMELIEEHWDCVCQKMGVPPHPFPAQFRPAPDPYRRRYAQAMPPATPPATPQPVQPTQTPPQGVPQPRGPQMPQQQPAQQIGEDVLDPSEVDMESVLECMGATPEQIGVLSGGTDARDYGMQHYGSKRVQGNHIQTWTLTPKDVRSIYQGVEDILSQEGAFDEDDEGADPEFDIEVMSTGQFIRAVPLSRLQSGQVFNVSMRGNNR